jgi:1,2-phenylacetyl-CoA epoxidase PaaB subunit
MIPFEITTTTLKGAFDEQSLKPMLTEVFTDVLSKFLPRRTMQEEITTLQPAEAKAQEPRERLSGAAAVEQQFKPAVQPNAVVTFHPKTSWPLYLKWENAMYELMQKGGKTGHRAGEIADHHCACHPHSGFIHAKHSNGALREARSRKEVLTRRDSAGSTLWSLSDIGIGIVEAARAGNMPPAQTRESIREQRKPVARSIVDRHSDRMSAAHSPVVTESQPST